jgi:ABC-2 type transport system permease protein
VISVARPGTAVTGLAVRQVRRGAVVVAAVSAGMSALVAATYRSAVGGDLDASSLAALAENPAIRTLFGEPGSLETAGGFAVWRTGTVLAVLVGVWGLLAATRLTRGEEDAGRWDLLLAGRVPIGEVVARHLVVLAAVPVASGLAVALGLVASGTGAGGAVLHGAGIAAVGVFFVGAGAVTAQVWPVRSAASGVAVAVLVAGLLVRMVGDGVSALSWLRWVSPFGLLELSRPYAGDRWAPVLLLAGAAVALVAIAVLAARGRDLRGGWLAPAEGRRPRPALLGSLPGFAVRRALRPLAGWALGIGAYFLLIGVIARSMVEFLSGNPTFARAATQAGFNGLDSVDGYAGTLFALLAVPVGVFTAIRLAAFAADDEGRRSVLLHALPISRPRLAGAEAAVTAAGATVLAATAGVAVWVGSRVVDAGLTFPDAVAGALNVLPVAALCLGAAVLALGVAPRWVAAIGSLPAAGGFLWQVVADSAGAPGWLAGVSPYAHLAAVPAEPVDRAGTVVQLAVALTLVALGLHAYRRRDLS